MLSMMMMLHKMLSMMMIMVKMTWNPRCGPWSIDYNDYNDYNVYNDDLKDNGEGDPQDAHLGRAAEVQDENWDKAQSSPSSKRGA